MFRGTRFKKALQTPILDSRGVQEMNQALNPPTSSEEVQKAVNALLRQPAIEFSRSLRVEMDANPEYLESHAKEIVLMMERHLNAAGIFWDEMIIEKNLKHLAKELIVALRSVEK